jgi:VWFA-related protein
MTPSIRALSAGLVALLGIGVSPRQQEPKFTASTTAVIVDVVVRDKQKRPVGGLTADDFSVFEDGKRQEITSFAAIGAAPSAQTGKHATANGATSDAAAKRDDPPFVAAMVFEQLGPTAKSLALHGATRLLDTNVGPAGFAGIFTIDQVVHPVVNFTNNRVALDDGLKKVSMTAGEPLQFAPTVGSAESSGPPVIEIPSISREPGGLRIRMLQTLDALTAIVAAMEHLPGRKSVILFSEGLATGGWLDDDRHDRLLHVAEQANRSHVAFYTFDAAGLRVAGTVGLAEAAPYVALQTMAQETGGAFVDSTNDLTQGIDQVTADLRQYYLLGYSSSKAPDDKYRSIDVKVKGKDLTVLARKGYRASRGPDLAVVKPAEVAPLLLLDRSEETTDVPLRAGTLRVVTADAQDRRVLLARVPLNALTFGKDSAGSRSTARLTIVARVKDRKSDVVQYAAQTYDLTSQAGQARAITGDIFFYRDVTLPPGPLVLEVAAYDANGQRGGVLRQPLEASAADPRGLRAGSLIIAYKLQRRGASAAAESGMAALRFGDWMLLPNLGEPLVPTSDLVFGFEAFADPGGSQPEGTIAVAREGQSVAVTALPLSMNVAAGLEARIPRPEAGRIAYVGHIPVVTLAPGSYSLELTLRQGAATLRRTAPFIVQAGDP